MSHIQSKNHKRGSRQYLSKDIIGIEKYVEKQKLSLQPQMLKMWLKTKIY